MHLKFPFKSKKKGDMDRSDDVDQSDDERGQDILDVFNDAFGDLVKGDPSAMCAKYRKMCADAFAFYRGSACLFYYDQAREENDPFLNDKTSQIWMHGDLHAENFGTYMGNEGRLIFNVNDFDEAYVGPFTWDLKRFAASIALIGYTKALSDGQISDLVKNYASAYRKWIHAIATGQESEEVHPFTLFFSKGAILNALRSARLTSRVELLDSMTEIKNHERRFKRENGAYELDSATKGKVESAYAEYLKTLSKNSSMSRESRRIKDVCGKRGIGIGSAGLPVYNILLEGPRETFENDVIISMKESQPAAVSRFTRHSEAEGHFKHEGHRTVLSQRALQAHADPWLGWTEMDGKGHLVAELSPCEIDLEWGDINEPEEMAGIVADLGRATAIMHGAGDDDARHSDLVPFSPEKAIDEAISKGEFEEFLVRFALKYSAQIRKDHRIFVDLFRNGKVPGIPDSTDL